MQTFLITGVSGYIGSHLASRLRQSFPTAVISGLDKLPAEAGALTSVNQFHLADAARDLRYLISGQRYTAVFHLAAYISVEESVSKPTEYYTNNINSTLNLVKLNADHFIFASTGAAFAPTNPYAYSKIVCEHIVRDNCKDRTIFRFYNVSGMDKDYKMVGQPTHLIRRAALAAAGKIPKLTVYGTDWNTKDGTAVRDYIHVHDICDSMIQAAMNGPSQEPYDSLGTSNGYTVMEVINAMKKVSGIDFPVELGPRRDGDFEKTICENPYKHLVINNTLDDMCLSTFESVK